MKDREETQERKIFGREEKEKQQEREKDEDTLILGV